MELTDNVCLLANLNGVIGIPSVICTPLKSQLTHFPEEDSTLNACGFRDKMLSFAHSVGFLVLINFDKCLNGTR